MGLITALKGTLTSALADQWKEFFYCDSMDQNTLVMKGHHQVARGSSNTKGSDNIISDGSKIVVGEGQVLLVTENGKVIDFCSEAGAYIYKTGTEPSIFDSGFNNVKDIIMNTVQRYTFGGQASNDQRVYYVNAKEIMNNKIGIGNVPFRDSEFNFTIKLRGFGSYSFKITNPVLFFQNVCGNVKEVYRKDELEQMMRSELQSAIQPALGKIALKGIPYDQLTLYTREIGAQLNEEMSSEWRDKRGVEVVTFALASVQPDEESAKKINMFQESRVYTDPSMLGARIGSAQANAMETAAGNSAGAMTGFMGMGMAQQSGGMNPFELMQMGQQQRMQQQQMQMQQQQMQQQAPAAPAAPVQANAAGWFCPECGSQNTGKFCTNCGTKRPAGAPVYQCDKCGWKPADPTKPPKFCPNCGDPFTDDDLVQ